MEGAPLSLTGFMEFSSFFKNRKQGEKLSEIIIREYYFAIDQRRFFLYKYTSVQYATVCKIDL